MSIRKPKNITPLDKAKVLMKDWLGNQEIMILAECGSNKAIEIKKNIQLEIMSDGKLFTHLVKKDRVLDYLELDEKYIYKQAEMQMRLGL